MLSARKQSSRPYNSEDVHENALLIVLAFALGGGVVWYVTKDRGGNAGASFPQRPADPCRAVSVPAADGRKLSRRS
jgi:hypothetical protein